MGEVVKGPFSRIITSAETQVMMVTTVPDSEAEINEVGEHYAVQFRPSSLTYERGMAIKDTPEGEVAQPVIIWRAKWDHEENEFRCLLEPFSLQ